MVDEKIYTVPLRKEFLKVAKYNRSKKAMKALKEFLLRHLKEEVKVGKYLNEELTKRRRNPPGKIKIRVEGEKGKYKAELVNAPKEKKEETPKKKKLLERLTKKDEKKPEKEEEKKKEETKEAIKEPLLKKDVREKKEEKIVEGKHAHRTQEKIIPTEKAGQLRKD